MVNTNYIASYQAAIEARRDKRENKRAYHKARMEEIRAEKERADAREAHKVRTIHLTREEAYLY